MLALLCACSSWTAPQFGRALAAPQHGHSVVTRQRTAPVVLEEKDTDGELLMVVLRTLERLEAKIDYLEGKVDNMGAQGLEQKWRLERMEGKVGCAAHVYPAAAAPSRFARPSSLASSRCLSASSTASWHSVQVDYLGGHLMQHFGISGEDGGMPEASDEEVLARMKGKVEDEGQ